MMRRLLWTLVLTVAAPAATVAATDPNEGARAVQLLTQLVRLDTSNPPGDTRPVAGVLKSLFDEEGIPNEVILAPNGKAAHFIARLEGSGPGRPVLLAAHTDVVPVERERWTVDPFAANQKDGYIYGRGVLDDKGQVAAFARAVIRIKHAGVQRKRDVIFLAEADEEQGSFNTTWLAQDHWDRMDAEFVLNEGGSIERDAGGTVRTVTVSTADKLTVSLRLSVTGASGHSSRPLPIQTTANGQLITALARLQAYQTPVELTDATRDYLRVLARQNPGPFSAATERLLAARDPDDQLARASELVAADAGGWGIEGLLRNTFVITMLHSGIKPNVIPGVAEATLNARLLPGNSVESFIEELARVLNNSAIHIEIISGRPEPDLLTYYRKRGGMKPSSTATPLYRAIEHASLALWPQSTVAPTLLVASTDATPWRQLGIPVYGIGPFPRAAGVPTGIHGDNENVELASFQQGAEWVYRILKEVVTTVP